VADALQTTTATPTAPVSGSVTFTPSTSNEGWGGSTKSTTATFTTAVGIPGVTEEPKEVTLSRVIPVAFDITGVNPANNSQIPATATDVTVTASTNMKWWIQLGSGGKDETADPSTYTTGGTRTVTIPAHPTRTADSWTTNGSITVNAGYDAQNNVPANTPDSYAYTRLPYTLKVTAPERSAATSVTLTVETNAPEYWIILKADSPTGAQLYSSDWTTGESKTATFNWTASDRVVYVVNGLTGAELASFVQPGAAGFSKIVLVKVTDPQGNAEEGFTNAPCPEGYVTKWTGGNQHTYTVIWMEWEGNLAQGTLYTALSNNPSGYPGDYYTRYNGADYVDGKEVASNGGYRPTAYGTTVGEVWVFCYK
jgi:hypothetical protein